MKKRIIISISIIGILALGFGIGYLATNGSYHTNSWTQTQAQDNYQAGIKAEGNQILSQAGQCPKQALVIGWTGTSTYKTVCY